MKKLLPLIVFVIVLGFARVFGAFHSLPNFQPLGALFFCGAAVFGARWIWVPALAWFLTVPVTSALNGYGWSVQFLVPVIGFAFMTFLALRFHQKNAGLIFAGSLASAVLFYFVTNSLSWAFDPAYTKSLTGWWQALTVGLPGLPPTWIFFRNELLSQALFSGVFLLAYRTVKEQNNLRTATA